MKSRILVIVCITLMLAIIHRHAKNYHARHSQQKTALHTGAHAYQVLCFSLPGIQLLLSQL
ncbi:hypothetical protein [Deminuibacter soli]|uniref:Uncharacterized protein n=1 Tax=Deminuibacter soli TaxID=2291815 RepID=A0A3E1NRS3_9BACT|nr:hypothetical protein [Deminuibacter soli]RFM30544.1 hypothetical protein DXN05_06210 [Deminuibacter soli]